MRSKVSGMIKVLVITFIVCISVNCQTYAFFLTDNGAVISLDVTSEDVKTVFKQIAMSSGVNIVVDDTLTSKVTISINDVPYDQAIEVIAKISGAISSFENGVYIIQNSRNIYTPQTSQGEQEVVQMFDLSEVNYDTAIKLIKSVSSDMSVEEFPEMKLVLVRGAYSKMSSVKSVIDQFIKDFKIEDVQDKVMSVVRLAYADPSEVAMAVQGQFQDVKIQASRTNNSILISGPEDNVRKIEETVKSLDYSPALIAFEVEVLEINTSDGSNVGIDWTDSQGQPIFSISFKEADIPYGNITENAIDFRPWARSSIQILTQIKLLQENGNAKVLARPSLATLENKTAKMVTGDRYIVMVNQVNGTTIYQQMQYIDAGVQLEMTPKLDSNGEIVVTLLPRINGVTGFSKEGYPITSTREVQTTVRIKDGETLIIGGLMRTEEVESESGLPILGKIPVIGKLFSSTKTTLKTTELVIMVTPRIMGSVLSTDN